MAYSIDDIISQLRGLGGGTSGATQSFAAPDSVYSPTAQTGIVPAAGSVGGVAAQAGNQGLSTGLGMNLGTGQLALGGLGALASLWGGIQANSLAKDQFNFTKQTTNTNLNNQIKSYNTSLEDRINARAAMQGNDSAYVNDYLSKNKLSR